MTELGRWRRWRCRPRAGRAGLAAALLCAAAPGQWPWGPVPLNSQWQQPNPQQPGQQPQEPGMQGGQQGQPYLYPRIPFGEPVFDPEIYGVTDPFRLESFWMRPGIDVYQGFPVFPQTLRGYGSYPTSQGQQRPTGPVALPVPLPPEPPDWPAWIKAKAGAELPYDPTLAVLVRQAERVWSRLPDEEAFAPLYHWDSSRGLPAGSRVKVPQTGEFLLLFHGGTRVTSSGACEAAITKLEEAGAAIQVDYLTRVQLNTFERAFSCTLPDGSELQIDAPPPSEELPPGRTELIVDRIEEPFRYTHRATIFNSGDRPCRWNTPHGSVQIDPGRRVTFFLVPPATALPADLVEEGVHGEDAGAARRWRAAGQGAVSWSGARFALATGATLEIDPMLGSVFGPKPEGGHEP